uniref:Uncharacterized protein n=1 Tax=Tetraselmis sp. GSL018 TaxID=582737 RepID=A0A061SB30_9CHLO
MHCIPKQKPAMQAEEIRLSLDSFSSHSLDNSEVLTGMVKFHRHNLLAALSEMQEGLVTQRGVASPRESMDCSLTSTLSNAFEEAQAYADNLEAIGHLIEGQNGRVLCLEESLKACQDRLTGAEAQLQQRVAKGVAVAVMATGAREASGERPRRSHGEAPQKDAAIRQLQRRVAELSRELHALRMDRLQCRSSSAVSAAEGASTRFAAQKEEYREHLARQRREAGASTDGFLLDLGRSLLAETSRQAGEETSLRIEQAWQAASTARALRESARATLRGAQPHAPLRLGEGPRAGQGAVPSPLCASDLHMSPNPVFSESDDEGGWPRWRGRNTDAGGHEKAKDTHGDWRDSPATAAEPSPKDPSRGRRLVFEDAATPTDGAAASVRGNPVYQMMREEDSPVAKGLRLVGPRSPGGRYPVREQSPLPSDGRAGEEHSEARQGEGLEGSSLEDRDAAAADRDGGSGGGEEARGVPGWEGAVLGALQQEVTWLTAQSVQKDMQIAELQGRLRGPASGGQGADPGDERMPSPVGAAGDALRLLAAEQCQLAEGYADTQETAARTQSAVLAELDRAASLLVESDSLCRQLSESQQSLRRQLSLAESRLSRTEGRAQAAEDRACDLEESLRGARSRDEERSREREELLSRAAHAEHVSAQAEVRASEAELRARSSGERAESLGSELEGLQGMLRERQREIDELWSRARSAEATSEDAAARAAEAERRVAKAEQRAEAAERREEALKQEGSRAREALQVAQQGRDDAEAELAKAEQLLRRAQAEASSHEREAKRTREALQSAMRRAEGYSGNEGRIAELEDQIRALEAEREEHRETEVAMLEEIHALQMKVYSLEKSAGVGWTPAGDVQQQASARDMSKAAEEWPENKARILEQRLAATLEAESELAEQMAADLAVKERERLSMKSRLEAANQQLQAYQVECQQLRGQIYSLTNQQPPDRGLGGATCAASPSPMSYAAVAGLPPSPQPATQGQPTPPAVSIARSPAVPLHARHCNRYPEERRARDSGRT